jgi:hypothetical protein
MYSSKNPEHQLFLNPSLIVSLEVQRNELPGIMHGRIPESEVYVLTEEQIRSFHQDGALFVFCLMRF